VTLIFDLLYLFGTVVVGPVYLLVRLAKKKATAPWAERLWRFPAPQTDRPKIWIHGVSVGEILAARGLVRRLALEWPNYEVVLSCTTPAGFEVARQEFPDLTRFYCPLDYSFAVGRAFRAIQPRLFILMELELWPNLLLKMEKERVPVVLANGRISKRSARGYRKLQWIHPRLLAPISRFLMQNDDHAERLKNLAVPSDRIEVFGNLKVDNLSFDAETSLRLAKELGLDCDLVFVAGSTHPGEDEVVFRAYLSARKDLGSLRLVVAPRHLGRLDAIESLAQSLGLKTVRRKDVQVADDKNNSVILVDTMGELPTFFGLADVVFLGGSLAPIGGHNVLEPAACGVIQILGPHTESVQGFVDELKADGAAVVAHDELAMTRALCAILADGSNREAAEIAALDVVERHRGALGRTIKVLGEIRLLDIDSK
jgi:3-deoxy-D-manno-octulosonic-acid transferase